MSSFLEIMNFMRNSLKMFVLPGDFEGRKSILIIFCRRVPIVLFFWRGGGGVSGSTHTTKVETVESGSPPLRFPLHEGCDEVSTLELELGCCFAHLPEVKKLARPCPV